MKLQVSSQDFLEDRLLSARSAREALFILVNESRQVLPCEFAAFLPAPQAPDMELTFASIAKADKNAPCVQFLRRLEQTWDARPLLLQATDAPGALRQEWAQWLPPHVLVCPVFFQEGDVAGHLLLGRGQVWTQQDVGLALRLGKVAGAMLRTLRKPGFFTRARMVFRMSPLWVATVLLLGVALVPVPSAVLGLGEVVPLEPSVVRSPVDGIVQRMAVEPFQSVAGGDTLVVFEQLKIDNQIQVARENLASAEEAVRQAQQGALFMMDSVLRLPELEVRREEARTELAYLTELKKRMNVVAQGPGIALIENYPSWAGKAVSMGERLLTIADPDRMEVKIWVPAADAALLRVGDRAHLYLNLTPNTPITATVRSIGYQPRESPKAVLAYEVLATIDQGVPEMRIGYFGTGRIFGEKMPLGFYLLRRPLAIMRMWLGV
ncbi:hypothetical protein MASR1M90_17120 [Desulfovibrionales bacterium]